MGKSFTSTRVESKNHDWDFEADDAGNITALFVKASVSYTSPEGTEMVKVERIDIWSALSVTRKTRMQDIYDMARQYFNAQFEG